MCAGVIKASLGEGTVTEGILGALEELWVYLSWQVCIMRPEGLCSQPELLGVQPGLPTVFRLSPRSSFFYYFETLPR